MIKPWLLPFFTLMFFSNSQAFAHGEDKPGPNRGYIRMSGSFHTELVKVSDRKFKLFLLDLNWKNPTTQNSSVEVKVGERPVQCESKSSHYECTLPKGISLKSAKPITIKAKRENVTGGIVTYELPLKFTVHP